MKIAFSKLTQNVDLHPELSSQVFNFERYGLMKELCKRGHTFRMLAVLNKSSIKLLEDVKAGKVKKVKGFDVKWMKNIEYDPFGMPKNEDMMFVEHGAVNTMFGNDGEGPLQLFSCREQIGAFKGLVVIYNADPDLPFPIHKMAGAKRDWSHPKNPYNIETKNNTLGAGKYKFKNHKNLERYGWGDWEDFFTKDKKIVILTKSVDPQKMIDQEYGGARGLHTRYHKKGLLQITGLPSVYPREYVDKFEFNKDPEYDVFYAGYPRSREPSFRKLFQDMPRRLKMVTSGQWSKKRLENELPNRNQLCVGMLKGLWGVPQLANNSKVVLQLGVKKSKQFDFVTTRHFEAVFSKTICLYDADYACMGEYLGKDFALVSKDDAIQKYMTVAKMSPEQRYILWSYQYELCKNLNFQWYVTEFEKLCKSNGVKVKPKKYKWEEINITKDMKKAIKSFIKTSKNVKVSKVKISKRRKRDE